MEQYNIPFEYMGAAYIADVTVIGGLDDEQYAISVRDPLLAEQFKTIVFRRNKDDNSWEYPIPLQEGGDLYVKALADALKTHLSSE